MQGPNGCPSWNRQGHSSRHPRGHSVFLEVAYPSWGSLCCNTPGSFGPAPMEFGCLGIYPLKSLPWDCFSGGLWLGPTLLVVTSLYLLMWRLLPRTCSSEGHWLRTAPVEVAALGLLWWRSRSKILSAVFFFQKKHVCGFITDSFIILGVHLPNASQCVCRHHLASCVIFQDW